MSDMKDYMISKNKAEEYARKLTNAEYERKKTLVKQDVILDAIVAEIRSLICEYQDNISRDFEKCLKNLIDQIEGYKQ
jgi:ribosomal protein S17E